MPPPHASAGTRDSQIRFLVIGVTTLVSLLLYLDRFCLTFAERFIKHELDLSENQMGWVLSAFFWTYAFAQVPAGWLSDRFGPRRMLTLYIVTWSLLTCVTSAASSFAGLMLIRLSFGLAQAGAYPASAGLLSKWAPAGSRGLASGVVGVGGRIGGFMAPVATAFLMAAFHATWRMPMLVFGGVGFVVAAVFWICFRDRPANHPWCNSGEVRRIEDSRPATEANPHAAVGMFPWLAILKSSSMWFDSISQFGTNVGWLFLVSWLPRYLVEVHDVPDGPRSWMTGIPLVAAWFGTVSGGWLTDRMSRAFGLRWGRSLPGALSRLIAVGAYLCCLLHPSPWVATLLFCLVSIGTDLGVASVWALKQDIGGPHAGSLLGWGNMWGNLGAAVSPVLLNFVVGKNGNWDAAFVTCAAAFLVSSIASLGIDATKKLKF